MSPLFVSLLLLGAAPGAPEAPAADARPSLRLIETFPGVGCGGLLPTPGPIRRSVDRGRLAERFTLVAHDAASAAKALEVHWSEESVRVSWRGQTSSVQAFEYPTTRGVAMGALLVVVAVSALLTSPLLLVAPLVWIPLAPFLADDLGQMITWPFIGTVLTWLAPSAFVVLVGLFALSALDIGGECAADEALQRALDEVGFPPGVVTVSSAD